MPVAKSIPVEKLTEIATEAARHVLADRMKDLGGSAEIGIFPEIGTIGIIIRDWDFRRTNVAEVFEMSEKLTEAMGDIRGRGEPVFRVTKDIATMGFFPPDPIVLRDLR